MALHPDSEATPTSQTSNDTMNGTSASSSSQAFLSWKAYRSKSSSLLNTIISVPTGLLSSGSSGKVMEARGRAGGKDGEVEGVEEEMREGEVSVEEPRNEEDLSGGEGKRGLPTRPRMIRGREIHPSTITFIKAYLLGYLYDILPPTLALLISLIRFSSQSQSRASLSARLQKTFVLLTRVLMKAAVDPRGMAVAWGVAMGGGEWMDGIGQRWIDWREAKERAESRRNQGKGDRDNIEGGVSAMVEKSWIEIPPTSISTSTPVLASTTSPSPSLNRNNKAKGFSALRPLSTFSSSLLSSFLAIILLRPSKTNKGKKLVKTTGNSLTETASLSFTMFFLVRAFDTLLHLGYEKMERGVRRRENMKKGSKGVEGATVSIWEKRLKKMERLGDVLGFWLGSWRIMWCWFYHPYLLPNSYINWITRLARMDTRLLDLLRLARKGEWAYGQRLQPGSRGDEISRGLVKTMGKQWTIFESPEFMDHLDCFIVHGKTCNSPSCWTNTGKRWLLAFRDCLWIYGPVHLIPRLLFMSPKKLARDPIRSLLFPVIRAASRSAAFLATFVASVWFGVCFTRTLLPSFLRLSPSHLPQISQQLADGGLAPMVGSALCGWSVLIENERRRGEMALYVAMRALYTVLDSLPKTIRRRKNVAIWSERFAFATSVAVVYTAMIHSPSSVRGIVKGIMGVILDDRTPGSSSAPINNRLGQPSSASSKLENEEGLRDGTLGSRLAPGDQRGRLDSVRSGGTTGTGTIYCCLFLKTE